jgi:peroxiredoxin
MTETDRASARPAPELALPDTGGETHSLATDPGNAATVVFWTCNHCPYALAWHDRLVDVATDYADRGVRFLAVNSNDSERYPADGPDAMRERVEREAWPFPYLWDESQEAARA